MRFLKVTTFYGEYLQLFYERRPHLRLQPFEQQLRELMWDGFGWADFFQHALPALGYEASELIINAEPLQRAWATEHGVVFPPGDWWHEIAFEQIRSHGPEILFLDDTSVFPADWIGRVRAQCPSVRLVLGWAGAPSGRPEAIHAYDAILSCVPELVAGFTDGGKTAFHLNHGFEPRILERIDVKREPTFAFTFVGQILGGSAFHEERRRMLLGLAERLDVDIYSPIANVPLRGKITRKLKPLLRPIAAAVDRIRVPAKLRRLIPLPPVASGVYDRGLQLPRALRKSLRPAVYGLEMFQKLHDSKATFNCHIGASKRSASNMRLFEATGAGACLVTDAKDTLGELFRDDEVVSYSSLEECVERVRWLGDNPTKAREIAVRGQKRTLSDHTYTIRAQRLDEIIRSLLARR